MSSQQWELGLTTDGPEEAHALVLGHSLGSSHVMWDEVVPALAPHLRVVRYDLPGHGGTAPAPVDEPLTMEQLVAALLRSLDGIGVDDFHVAGLSLGGMVALATAEFAPSRVLSTTDMSSAPVNLPPRAWVGKAAAVRRDGTGPLAEPTMERWFSEGFRTGRGRDWVDRIRAEFLACSPEGYAQCCEVLATTDLRPGLATITAPVLLVSGEDDAALPWAAADDLAGVLRAGTCPDVEVLRIPGVRHMSAVEEPATVARALLARTGATARE